MGQLDSMGIHCNICTSFIHAAQEEGRDWARRQGQSLRGIHTCLGVYPWSTKEPGRSSMILSLVVLLCLQQPFSMHQQIYFSKSLSIFESCFHCHITQPWRQAWQSHETQSYHVMQMMTFAGLAQTVWQCKECSILSDVGHRSEAVWKMAAWLRSYCATVLHLG